MLEDCHVWEDYSPVLYDFILFYFILIFFLFYLILFYFVLFYSILFYFIFFIRNCGIRTNRKWNLFYFILYTLTFVSCSQTIEEVAHHSFPLKQLFYFILLYFILFVLYYFILA